MATELETKTPKQAIVEGINLLAQGKRNLLCGEVHQAVNQLEEAAKIFSKEYGELANECADVYLLYGQALLELHRSESNVFENGLQSESSDDDDDDDDEEEGNVGGDKEDKVSDRESDGSEDLLEEELSNDVNKDGNIEQCLISIPTDCNKKYVVEDKKEKTSEENGVRRNEDEDVSNLQLSWETLEIAKLIYTRQEGPEINLKLADTYSKLGDVGLEMEQFEEAIKDYEECLNIQKSILPEDSRRIAETLYQLGIAHNLHKSYVASCNHFKASIQIMELRKNRLKKVADGELPPDTKEGGDGFYTPVELAAKEVHELAELINEVQAKIEEVEDEKNSAPNVSRLLKESLTSTGVVQGTIGLHSSNSLEASTSVHVITHLLRKKKASPSTEGEAKKQKLENVESPDTTSN